MTAREIPMLFSAPMVLALLARRKTQTRRFDFKGKPGDLIWVKESWRTYVSLDAVKPSEVWSPTGERGAALFYEAGGEMMITKPPGTYWSQGDSNERPGAGKLRPSMFLPRWGSRITLRVTDVRREPLQVITESDAQAEGIQREGRFYGWPGGDWEEAFVSHRAAYQGLWSMLNGSASWDANPTVSVISFDVLREGIASMTQPRAPEATL